MEMSGELHAPASLPPGMQPPVPIVWEAGRASEPVWTLWEQFLVFTANRTPTPRLSSLVAIPTELSRLVKKVNMEIKMSK
jgi:hypothetical protein